MFLGCFCRICVGILYSILLVGLCCAKLLAVGCTERALFVVSICCILCGFVVSIGTGMYYKFL